MHVQSTTTLIHHFHCQLLSVLAGEPHLSKSLLCVLTARVATWCGAETRLSDPADRRAASTKASRPLSHQNREQCSLGLPFFHLVRRGLASSPADRCQAAGCSGCGEICVPCAVTKRHWPFCST